MTITYRTGYGTERKTLTQLKAWIRFANIHPEIQKRVIGLMDAARAHGVDLGVGGGFRTFEEQKSLFLSRHNRVASGGCCSFEGSRYALVAGMAHAAPPYRSFHEGTISLNSKLYGVALDMVGWENGWMEKNLAAYGLRSFAALSGSMREPWHIQPIEFPTSRSSYDPKLHTLKNWTLPGINPPTTGAVDVPTPTLRIGSTGTEVRELQSHCRFWGWYPSTAAIDGDFGSVTDGAVKKMQAILKITQDGVYGTVTAEKYRQHLIALANL